jgi:hypothetical protein
LDKAELQLAFTFPALAPRMSWLETKFEDEGTLFHQDPLGRFAHLAAANPGLPARAWTKAGAPGFPLVVVNRNAEGPAAERRLRELIVPRYLLPPWVQEMYAQLASAHDRNQLVRDFDMVFLRMRVEPGGVRDLLVRGRPEEAVQRILIQEDRIDKALDANNREVDPVPNMVKNWVPAVIQHSRQLAELRGRLDAAAETEKQGIMAKMAEEVRVIDNLWRDRRATLDVLAVIWAVPEYRAHLTYFMAVAKMDLARRAEQRQRNLAGQPWPADQQTPAQLWNSALEWLNRYQALVLPLGRDPWQDAVSRQIQICNAQIGKQTAAK